MPTSSDTTSPALKGSVVGERALFAVNSPNDLERVCHKLWRAFVAAEAGKTQLSEDVEELRRQQEIAIREIQQKVKTDREKLARVLAAAAIKRARQELDSERLHQRMDMQRKKREFHQHKRDELQKLKRERQTLEQEQVKQAETLKQQQETLNRQQEQWKAVQETETVKLKHEKDCHTTFILKTQAELESQRQRQADELEQRKRVADQQLRDERSEIQAEQERQAAEFEQRQQEAEQQIRERQLRFDQEQALLEEEQSQRQQAFRTRFRMVEEVLRKLGLRHDWANSRVHLSGPHNNVKDFEHYPKEWRVG